MQAERKPRPGRLTPWRRRVLDQAFEQLLELDEAERKARLRRLLHTHPRSGQRLARLLAALAEDTDAIQAVIAELAESTVASLDGAEPDLPPGTRLGAWELIEVVGSGGMGTVYRARRADGAFEMDAAIKLIRSRHDRRLAARLAVERQLLARLDHPNIARILDGGTTAEGRSYLVMDWVPGADLRHHRIDSGKDLRQCLGRFLKIAEAVHHAHQRGIIHGDIKPANIRIGNDDRVRLLDFGVARLVAEEAGETNRTIGLTPSFSAPELRRGEPASTQSDVWALGALLLWMLTGQTIAGNGQSKSERTTALRSCCPRHQDVSAIIHMACAEDPEQRYAGVSALIKDLERYLDKQPVLAREQRAGYLFRRFVRRNPVAVGLGSACLALLILGLTATAWQAHLAGLERDRAEHQRDLARLESARTERVSEFLVELFEHADPHLARGREITARELLEQGAERLAGLEETPLVQAAMYKVLARVNRSLAEHETAHQLAQEAVSILSERTDVERRELADAWSLLGATLSSLGRYAEAEEAHRRALALTDTRDRPAVAAALNNIGLSLYSLGHFGQAEYMLREALEIRRNEDPVSAETASSLNNLALLLSATDRRDEAEPLYREALALRREVLGDDHPTTTYSMTNLATLLAQAGQWEEAEHAYLEALETRRSIFGPDHPAVASVLYQLGWLNSQRAEYRRAGDFYQQALAIRRSTLGQHHPSVGVILNALAYIARQRGDLEQSESHLEQALESYRRAYGDSHHDIALVLANLGATRMHQRRYDSARELLTEALEMNRRELGDRHRHVGDNLFTLAELYQRMGQDEQALGLAREARSVYQSLGLPSDHPQIRASEELIESR